MLQIEFIKFKSQTKTYFDQQKVNQSSLTYFLFNIKKLHFIFAFSIIVNFSTKPKFLIYVCMHFQINKMVSTQIVFFFIISFQDLF